MHELGSCSEVRHHHPCTRPDGARDIEAVFNGAQFVIDAVGFVNQATDSDAHKKSGVGKLNDGRTEVLRIGGIRYRVVPVGSEERIALGPLFGKTLI